MFEDIPSWAQVLLIFNGITLYSVFRLGKTIDGRYELIMRQLRPDAYRSVDDDD